MKEVVIVEGVRSPVGRRKGQFREMRPDELAAVVIEELVKRAGVDKGMVEDVILGCVSQSGEQGGNIARTAALIAGFPDFVPGVTIDRQCGSSQQAVHFGAQAILSGDMDIVIAGGVESMTRVPMFSNMQGAKPSKKLTDQYEIINQGLSAERIAEKWGFSRQQLDAYAVKSHERAQNAIDKGLYDKEIVSIDVSDEQGDFQKVTTDEGPRPGTTEEVLAGLKPAFDEQGVITAGNASQMSDGASTVLLMSKEKAQKLGLKPKARILARTVVGSDPTLMLTGPIAATKKVLEKAGLSIEDMDRYEVNEAFAPVPLAWLSDIGGDPDKLNVNGGAIALGHPLGATGTKLLVSLVHELERSDSRYGLLAICEGMGMANATIIERII
ncbi:MULTISPECIES: thiolase family protein [unclassified Planococcus (in: firmicutes)]|uniref:thiolase family protein n=1 Tax=unclassified Planococcus (in: firmicutes) TaxID=2662419 RepID=UPI000C322218|nr:MULTISPECIES: thiolase family protein [unclassified Planococcus (in: firmicutes)]AUD12918.1 acetyl-CoA C-acyltransferase [Planococcus sp. MB-3u-03]PKG47538.1 acetyl-CoA C-acyltransferase [Planococcus sp. Urea-trap-24]PKG88138.1 acetyl-CoA C-acyltransferase [Planococcus sp. Urea-3u-39]PKH36937.1 acetyl-CoA C-acyltransferase [Planococcus sp. MB-3u-09]